MLLGGLKFDLLVHFGLSVAITVLLLIRYGDQTSVDKFDWNHTLSGTAAIISLVHSVISGLNLAKDVLWTGEKCENKKKLKSGLWNFGRNLFTGLLMVLIGMLFGFNSSDEDLIAPLVLVALVRLSDSTLDCENVLAVQCTSKDESASRMFRTGFGAIGFISALILYIIYVSEVPFDWEGDNTGDEVALTVGIIGLCVHLVLVLLHLLLNNTGCKDTCVSNLAGKEANCDEVGIHLPNEIPIVSKIVFTLVLGSLAIVVGERIHEQLDITLLIWILLVIGSVEIAGRNVL